MIDMTLREKIGQMFMVGVKDKGHLKRMIKDHHVGGVIHFSRNGDTSKAAYEFTALAKTFSDIPLFISVDQEGGIVTRIKSGVTPLSGNMAVSATDDLKNSYKLSAINTRELGLLGFNMNLAPVVDINVNPKNPVIHTRSYGETADRVIAFSKEAFRAYEDHNMLSVIKHFPGHGDTTLDSHDDLPIVGHGMERLQNIELKPFKALIDKNIPSIMVSHVLFPSLDETRPSTLSKNIMTDLLRKQMKFQGMIFTDCMEMKAVSNYGYGEAAVQCIKAGVTMLLYSESETAQVEAMEAVYHAVVDGQLEESVIDQAVALILRYKKKYAIDNTSHPWSYVERKLCDGEDLNVSESIARNSITAVGSLEDYVGSKNVLRLFPNTDTIKKHVHKDELYDSLEDVKNVLEKRDEFVVLAYKQKTKTLLEILNDMDPRKVLLIPLISPYEMVAGFNGLLTYEISDLSMSSLLSRLKDKKTYGHCPVTLKE